VRRADGYQGDKFGDASAVSGDWVLSGAWDDGDAGDDAGAVFVHDRWGQLVVKLQPSDADKYKDFGYAIDVDGVTAIIGAPGWNGESAYVFDLSTGQELLKLSMAGVQRFGRQVAVDGTMAAVAAPGDVTTLGAVYIFDLTTGTQIALITASDGVPNDLFGSSIALDGGKLVVGAWNKNSGRGAAYLYDAASGQELFKWVPADVGSSDKFGTAVDLNAKVAVVGAIYHGLSGAAYAFDISSGQELYKILPDPAPNSMRFGQCVRCSTTNVFVSADGNLISNYIGKYDAATGVEVERFEPTADENGFGRNFGVDDDNLLSAGTYDNSGAKLGGEVLFFDLTPRVGGTYCWSWPNSTGAVAVIYSIGSTSVVDNDLTLRTYNLPANQFGYFVNSQTQGFNSFPGGSQGNLCLAGQLGRHSAQVLNTGFGAVELTIDITQVPTPGGLYAVIPGETWNWQFWYRDFNQNPTSNFTYGASVTFQ